MPKAALADHSVEWYRLAVGVRENAADVPFLIDQVDELERLLSSSQRIDGERAALDAQRQQLSRDLDAVKTRARIVAAQVRSGIRTKYGYGSEKLTVFGMRPRRRGIASRNEELAGAALVAPDGSGDPSDPGTGR